jgi:hypothetical protein
VEEPPNPRTYGCTPFTYGCSPPPPHLRLQPPSPTVAAPLTYGCSPPHLYQALTAGEPDGWEEQMDPNGNPHYRSTL